MESAFHLLDWLILFAYLAILTGIGVYFSRRQKTLEDMVRAGGGMGMLTVGLS